MQRDVFFFYLCSDVKNNKEELLDLELVKVRLKKVGIYAQIICLSYSSIDDAIEKYGSVVLCVFYLNPYNIPETLNLARRWKEKDHNKQCILASKYELIDYGKLIDNNCWIDYVISNTIEINLTWLIYNINAGHKINEKNIKSSKENKIYCSELFESEEENKALDRTVFTNNNLDFLNIDTHFHCAGNCLFCEQSRMKKYIHNSHKSFQSVVDEIEYLHLKYKVYKFCFTAPSFFDFGESGLKTAESIFEEIIRRKLDVSLNISLRAEQINETTLPILQKGRSAGLDTILVGFEFINNDELKLYKKKADSFDNYRAYKILRENNMYFTIGFIPFHPYTDLRHIAKNLDFLYEIGYLRCISNFVHQMIVFPNTSLFQKLQQDGLIDKDVFPRGFVVPRYRDNAVSLLREQLTRMDGEYKSLQANDSLEALITWTVAYIERNCERFSPGINNIVEELLELQRVQNDNNYIYIKECLKLCEQGDYNSLNKICDAYSTKKYYLQLKRYYMKLKYNMIKMMEKK